MTKSRIGLPYRLPLVSERGDCGKLAAKYEGHSGREPIGGTPETTVGLRYSRHGPFLIFSPIRLRHPQCLKIHPSGKGHYGNRRGAVLTDTTGENPACTTLVVEPGIPLRKTGSGPTKRSIGRQRGTGLSEAGALSIFCKQVVVHHLPVLFDQSNLPFRIPQLR